MSRSQSFRSSRFLLLVGVLLSLLLCSTVAHASYWSDEVTRVRTYTAATYMTRMAEQPGVSALPSGLLFSIVSRGHGDVAPAVDDVCEMHYTIRHRFGETVEDSRVNPYPVRRSPSQFFAGIAEAMQLMREGDRWEIYVPYQLAYGTEGNAEKKIIGLTNFRVDLQLLKCSGASGKTSAAIDAYLAPLMKSSMPPKTPFIDYADL